MPQTNEQKHEAAVVRQAQYDALTHQQKLDRLNKAFGKGVGARRERARIANLMLPKEPPLKKAEAVVEAPAAKKHEFASKAEERKYNAAMAAKKERKS